MPDLANVPYDADTVLPERRRKVEVNPAFAFASKSRR